MKQFEQHIQFGDHDRDHNRTLHFSGANGFAPATYQQFLGRLSNHFHVLAYTNRPLWSAADPWQTMTDWYPFVDDLITFLDAQKLSGIIGVGHSLGAVVTLLAAAKRPDLFDQLVIIEPPLQMPATFARWQIMREQIDVKTLPLVANALKRRAQWASREEAYTRYRSKRFFANWSDQAIEDYVAHGLSAEGDQYTLTFPPLWEGWIFGTIPFDVWAQLARVTQPLLAVRAAHTDVLAEDAWQHWQAQKPAHTTFVELAAVGHMLPFEAPTKTADAIADHLTR